MLAQSIVCPGFSTLVSNLFTTRDPQPTTEPWLGEYSISLFFSSRLSFFPFAFSLPVAFFIFPLLTFLNSLWNNQRSEQIYNTQWIVGTDSFKCYFGISPSSPRLCNSIRYLYCIHFTLSLLLSPPLSLVSPLRFSDLYLFPLRFPLFPFLLSNSTYTKRCRLSSLGLKSIQKITNTLE